MFGGMSGGPDLLKVKELEITEEQKEWLMRWKWEIEAVWPGSAYSIEAITKE